MPIDALAAAAAQAPTASLETAPVAAPPGDAERFAALMNPQAAAAPAGISPAVDMSHARTAGVPSAEPTRKTSMGDAILRSLDTAGQEYLDSNRYISEVLNAGGSGMGAADMIRIQVEVVKSSIVAELVGKGVSQTTKNIDQLTKLQ